MKTRTLIVLIVILEVLLVLVFMTRAKADPRPRNTPTKRVINKSYTKRVGPQAKHKPVRVSHFKRRH